VQRVQTLQRVLTDLLSSYLASMVDFIWFTDDKLLKFCHCNHKNAQSNQFHQLVEIVDCEVPDFMPPCCLLLLQRTFFISKPNKVRRQSRVATDSTS